MGGGGVGWGGGGGVGVGVFMVLYSETVMVYIINGNVILTLLTLYAR